MSRLGNRYAVVAGAARADRRSIGAHAIQRPRNQPRRGGFANATRTGEDKSVRQPPAFDGVGERAHQSFLADQLAKSRGPVFPGENAVVLMEFFGHQQWVLVTEVGDRYATRSKSRYGCFLPDLTGLARRSSATDLPPTL